MIVFLIFAIIFVVCIAGAIALWESSSDAGFPLLLCGILVGLVLFIMVACIISAPYDARTMKAQFAAFQLSIDEARANRPASALELAALTQKAASMNADLAATQYHATIPWISWFYSRELFDINPIK